MVFCHNVDHWEKDVFHNLNLKMMKINSNVNFLKPYFLITRNKPSNINIPCKYENVILLSISGVFVLIVSEMINIHNASKSQ